MCNDTHRYFHSFSKQLPAGKLISCVHHTQLSGPVSSRRTSCHPDHIPCLQAGYPADFSRSMPLMRRHSIGTEHVVWQHQTLSYWLGNLATGHYSLCSHVKEPHAAATTPVPLKSADDRGGGPEANDEVEHTPPQKFYEF